MFLRTILKDLEAVPGDVQDLKGMKEPEEGEKVLGVLEGDLKSLYVMVDRSSAEMEKLMQCSLRLQADLMGCDELTPDQRAKAYRLQQELRIAALKNNALKTLFWASVKMAMPQALDTPFLDVRKGFRVTSSERGTLRIVLGSVGG